MKKKTVAKKKPTPKKKTALGRTPALLVTVHMSAVNLQWYFHARSTNGEIVFQSEGYKNKADVLSVIELLRKGMRTAKVAIL